jgi:hypothetical protein
VLVFVALIFDPLADGLAVMLRNLRINRNSSVLSDDDAKSGWLRIAHDTPSPHCKVTLNEVMATVSPAVMAVVLKFRSAPEVAQFPWKITTDEPFMTRKYPAVPVFAAFVSSVIALAVAVALPSDVPLELFVGNGVAFIGSVESSVPDAAVSVVAG